jgi:hypothetical protein
MSLGPDHTARHRQGSVTWRPVMRLWRSSSIIDATGRLLFFASQSECLFALALFQKVMININLMAMGVNFQKGLFALAGLLCVGRFIMRL